MKALRKNILIPFDFSEVSENALKHGLEIARFIKGNVHLLFILEAGDMIAKLFRNDNELIKLSIETKSKLDKLADRYRKETGVAIHTEVVSGKVYEEVLKMAEKINARFIILGDDHREKYSENSLSSSATAIISRSEYPVIIAKGENTGVPKKIVVPLDLTKQTRYQVFNAIAFGIHYQAKIYLVSVVQGGINVLKSRIYSKLKKAQQTILENDVPCEIHVYERTDAPAYRKVLEYIKEVDADMLLMMTHQEGLKNDNYIGAFAYHIINESDIPVLALTDEAGEPDVTAVLKKIVDPIGILFDRNAKTAKKD